MKIFERYSRYCIFAAKFANFLYISCGVLMFLNPILVWMFTGEIVLPYGFKLPWIDEFSFIGYVINLCHHLLQTYTVVFGFICADGFYVVFALHVYCIYDVIMAKLDHLNLLLQDKDFAKDSKKVGDELKSSIQWHQDLLRYLIPNCFEDTF